MSRHHVTVPAAVLALLCGAVLGLLSFAASATLWRAGDHAAAGLAADAILLAALTGVAAVTLLAQPARQRRARVPVGRALPIAWWPTTADPLPGLALGVGAPLAAGAAAAAYLFR